MTSTPMSTNIRPRLFLYRFCVIWDSETATKLCVCREVWSLHFKFLALTLILILNPDPLTQNVNDDDDDDDDVAKHQRSSWSAKMGSSPAWRSFDNGDDIDDNNDNDDIDDNNDNDDNDDIDDNNGNDDNNDIINDAQNDGRSVWDDARSRWGQTFFPWNYRFWVSDELWSCCCCSSDRETLS